MSLSASRRTKSGDDEDVCHKKNVATGEFSNYITKTQNHGESSKPTLSFADIHVLQHHENEHSLPSIGENCSKNLFRLQVDELLAKTQPSYEKKFRGLDDVLHKLKHHLEKIKPRESQSISEASRVLQKEYNITVPYPDLKPSDHNAYKLVYERPSRFNIVGSYFLKTMIQSNSTLNIDLIVVMPNIIFQKKDFLNYRYFFKRAYYLACIAAGLESRIKEDYECHFERFQGNDLHPILIVKPKSKSTTYEVRIIPTASKSLFPLSRLRPNKNSIRLDKVTDLEIENFPPTPFYNSSLVSDCNFESYLNLLHLTSKLSHGFKDACILGRIWLQQRGFGGSIYTGGFGHFEWAALCALLLKGEGSKDEPVLLSGYSSFQIFRSFLQFLSTNDLISKPFIVRSTDIIIQSSSTPIFYDSLREHNILYKMSSWSYKLLQFEAKTTSDILSNACFDHFESIFITKISQPLLRFDYSFSISQNPELPQENVTDHISKIKRFSNRLYCVLREGLMDRVKLIYIKEHSFNSWPINRHEISLDSKPIIVSVIFDSKKIGRHIDHGPSAEDDTKAAYFRKFWGSKAELRRFKDGSILETLIWPVGPAQSIFENIVTYLIDRHYDSKTAESIKFMSIGIENLLPDFSTDLKQFETLITAFKSLENQIRSLEGLPLQVKQFSAIDSQLRYTSIQSPSFGPGRPMKLPANALIEFEGSGRWPDDLTAIQRIKAAFLLRIGNLLEQINSSIKTRLGLEDVSRILRSCAFLDIIYDYGPTFRLRIYCDREKAILQRQIKDKSIERHIHDDTVSTLMIYKKIYIQLPLLTQSIYTHCNRSTLLSCSIRLVKLWFNRHMLCRHFSEEIIELIVARIFLHPHPWRSPSSLATAFLRTITFLSKWDWRLMPLIVDFSGTMTKSQVNSINTQLEAWRKIDPLLHRTILLAASNHDLMGTAFSAHGPSKMIATRMTTLARSASKKIKEMEFSLDIKLLFTTSTVEYDFVIYLSNKFISNQSKKINNKIILKNLEASSKKNIEKIGYQPIQLYIAELESLYSSNVIFFYENYTGSLIAGLWNPQSMQPGLFKVNLSYSTCVLTNGQPPDGKVVINQTSIIAEIARLGGDLVSKIVMR